MQRKQQLYRCLARNRSGSRRSVPEARLQRSRKLAKHYQSKSILSGRECCTRDGTSATRARPQRLWKLPYRDLAESTCWSTMRAFLFRSPSRNTQRKLQHSSLDNACRLFVRVTARRKANAAAEVRQHRQHLNDLVDQPIAGVGAAVQIMLKAP